MEFLVVALDGTDAKARDRRMAAREAHLANFGRLKEQGHVVAGGALLDDDGGMVGSALILDFPDRAAVEKCISDDPYTKGDVWRDVTIRRFRMVR